MAKPFYKNKAMRQIQVFFMLLKNNKTMTEKMQVRKYDPVAKKHVCLKKVK